MLFGSRPNALAVIKRNEVSLYWAKGLLGKLDVPIEVVRFLEVRDPVAFGTALAKFLDEHGVRGQRVLVLLDESVIFQRIIARAGSKKAEEIATFTKKLPFEAADKQVIALQIKDRLVLCGTNKKLYQPLVEALLKGDCKVSAVAPAALYEPAKTPTLLPEAVTAVLHDAKRALLANFLEEPKEK